MKKIFFIALSFLSLQLFSQSVEFKGKVIDNETSNVISGAQITIEDTSINTFTDANGQFSIKKEIPVGEQIVSVLKSDYETKFLIITVIQGEKIEIQEIKLELTKKAKNKRKKIIRELNKRKKEAQKEKEKKLKKLKKQAEEKRKKLEKKKKTIRENSDDNVVITYTDTTPTASTTPTKPIDYTSETQIKYGKILGVEPQEITNTKLYDFIDSWMGVPYLLGGENRSGIDCSSFTQLLYIKVYDEYIERTAQKQYNSKSRDKFKNIEYLKEGDLMFFKSKDENGDEVISHVGLYLRNGYFVNSTSKRGVNNVKGVQICNINDRFWKRKYVGAARRNKK